MIVVIQSFFLEVCGKYRSTTRNSLNTNDLTHRILLSVIWGHNYRQTFFVYHSAGIYRRTHSIGIYRQNDRRNIQNKKGYSLLWRFLRVILLTESPRDSKRQLRTVTWPIHHLKCRRNHRGIQTRSSVQWRALFTVRMADGLTDGIILSVSLLVKVNIYPLCRPSPFLFLLLLPHPNSPLLQSTSPQKKIFLFSAQQVIFLEVLWSQHPCFDLLTNFINFCK